MGTEQLSRLFINCKLVVNYSIVTVYPCHQKKQFHSTLQKGDTFFFGKVLQYFSVHQHVIASVQRLVVTSKDPFVHDSIPIVKVQEHSLYVNICDICEKCVYRLMICMSISK